MTRRRRDNHSTEFGLWLREQREIDSSLGYMATNLDYIWFCSRTGEWLMIEEKRHGSRPRRFQMGLFRRLDQLAQHDPFYRGFYIVTFERKSPEDGRIWINGRPASRSDLIALLQFDEKAIRRFRTSWCGPAKAPRPRPQKELDAEPEKTQTAEQL